jgi:hypothetical protein
MHKPPTPPRPVTPTVNRRSSRRQQPKRTARVSVRLGSVGTGPKLALSLLDLSEGGVRVLTGTPLRPGQAVEISLEALWLAQPLRRGAEVVWCVAAANGQHAVGMKFDKRLSPIDFQSLAYV